jgi:hypothetical protein
MFLARPIPINELANRDHSAHGVRQENLVCITHAIKIKKIIFVANMPIQSR